MKKIYLVIMMQIAVCTLFAQRNEPAGIQRNGPVNSMKDKQQYRGYTVRLLPGLPSSQLIGSYGFDILKGNNLVVHQLQSPMPFAPKGIQKKEDAYKIAQWMIEEYKKTGHWQGIIPPHITRSLKIQTH